MKITHNVLLGSEVPIEFYILVTKKYLRPRIKKGDWDTVTAIMGKSKKVLLSGSLRLLLYALWDRGYLFREPPPKIPKTNGMCSFPLCQERGSHPHHITYSPPVVKKLCPLHHREITAININESDRVGGKLSNRHRFWAFGAWLRGELHPQWTPHVEEWLSSWED